MGLYLTNSMLAKRHFLPPYMPRLGEKIFGTKPQKFDTGGALLENFGQIFEKMWRKNAIKVNFLDFQKNFRTPLMKRQQNGFFRGVEKNPP